jgi:hypothetical protein
MAAALAKFEEGAVYLPERALWLADLEAELFAFLLTAAMTASAPPSVGPRFPRVIADELIANMGAVRWHSDLPERLSANVVAPKAFRVPTR